MSRAASAASVNPDEVAKFSAIASEWWDATGKFAPLHALNPVRIKYIRDTVCRHFSLDAAAMTPFSELSFLDVGCGGGLLSEPFCRLGAQMTSVDAAEENIKTASVHAAEHGLNITYVHGSAEALADEGRQFDVVLNMEVIEHVANPQAFVKTCASLVKPGGLMFLATLNRTVKSYALAIVGAEYVLRWLPRGTHNWDAFLKPSELDAMLRAASMRTHESVGVSYNPLSRSWKLSPHDLSVNYMICAKRAD